MGACNVGYEKACEECGSTRLGAIHNPCGNLMCACEPCTVCNPVNENERKTKRRIREELYAFQENWED